MWQNTLEFNQKTTASVTAYYTSGYDMAQVDFGGIKGDCEYNAENHTGVATYEDGTPVLCRAKGTYNVDFSLNHQLNDRFTLYVNVLNVLDIEPPFDPSAAYGIFGFNPAWGGPNIMGRYFRVGARVNF
jgi:iron complex outermembrane receptor protein